MSFSVFRGMVSWASVRANPQAYGPLGSAHPDPRALAGRWRPPPAPRPSPVGPGAIARAKTWCSPPAGCSPQSRGTESQAHPSFHLHKARKRGGGALSPPKGGLGQDPEKDPEKFTPQEDQRMKWPSNEECVVVYAAAEKKARKFWERLEGSDKKQKIMRPVGIAVSGANAKEATPVTTEQLVGTDPVEGPPLPFTLEADDKE